MGEDPAGTGGHVLLGEIGAPNQYRLFNIPFSGLDGRTIHVSFRACSPDGVRAAVVLKQHNKRDRIKLIDPLPRDMTRFIGLREVAESNQYIILFLFEKAVKEYRRESACLNRKLMRQKNIYPSLGL